MDYYKTKKEIRNAILTWLQSGQNSIEWDELKKRLQHKHLVGELTLHRILKIYGLEEKEGKLENVKPTNSSNTVPDTKQQSPPARDAIH